MIYNPVAGRYPSRLLAERACEVLNREGWDISIEQSQGGAHITALAKKAGQEGLDALFVIGGDGSLNHAVAGLVNTQTALGILPAGTANVWAQELGLSTLGWTRWMALEKSAISLANGVSIRIDIGLCNNKPFLLWSGVGLDGYIVHKIEPRSRWEKSMAIFHYGASAIWYASKWPGITMDVQVDGKKIKGHYLLLLASNIQLYAGGLIHLSPENRLDDGTMDLWLLEGEHMGDTIRSAWELFTGRFAGNSQVSRIPFKSLCIQSSTPMYIQLDGEPLPAENKVEIQVLPRSLQVLVPKVTPYPISQEFTFDNQDK